MSAETKEKLRQINLGKRVSDETRAKISLALKGNRKLSDTQKEALRLINKGRLITEETREKMRQSHLGKRVSLETRAKMSKISKERWANAGTGYRERCLEKLHTTECRKKAALARTGHPVSPKTRNKIKSTLMGHTFTEGSLAKMRRTQKRLWANPEYKKMVREAMCNGLPMSPNNRELALLDILNNLYPDEWAFVGDFTLVIDGKSPDFANINGKKLLIELFGDYWHKGQKPEKRIAIFSKFGYRTLVVWECELKDTNKLTERICEFVG